MRFRQFRSPSLVVAFVLASLPAAGQERPLPEPGPFLEEVKRRLQTDEERQNGYAYVETRRRLQLAESGEVQRESVRVFESYPGLPGERRWRRLISRDGTRVSDEVLQQRDRERQDHAQQYARELASHPDPERAAAGLATDPKLARRTALIEDAFRVFDMRMRGRELLDGHVVIAFDLVPRPDAKPRTREGKMMRNFTARAWISESDRELVRLEAEAKKDVTIGLGFLARIHRGGRAEFHRVKVNDEIWLPARAGYIGSARLLLFKVLRQSEVTEYSDYRKFTVTTNATYSRPQ
jgi:hypothetical protein